MYQKGDIQFTPPELAKELVALAGVRKDSRVLEPEAGIGNIADAAKEVTDHVDCIERMTDFCEILKLKKHNVIGNDLLTAETAPIYDAVVMNPPFSEECEHIKGHLTSFAPAAVLWRSVQAVFSGKAHASMSNSVIGCQNIPTPLTNAVPNLK